MSGWKAIAAARCPDIPAESVESVAPVLDALEASFRPLAERLTEEQSMALKFSAE